MIVVLAVAVYTAAGAVIAGAFLVFGVTRVLVAPASITPAARILLFPGALALWRDATNDGIPARFRRRSTAPF